MGQWNLEMGILCTPPIVKDIGQFVFALMVNKKSFRVARLVVEAFIPNPYNKEQVDHINTISNDDRVENLRWCTRCENMQNPLTREKLSKQKGIKIKMVCSNGDEIIYNSIIDASRQIPINRETIYNSLNGKIIKNNNIRFEYVTA